MNSLKSLLVAGTMIAMGASAANAATESFTSNVVPLTSTNFTGTALTLTQFDPSLGTLTGVSVHLHGDVLGSVQAQNLDAQAATVTLTLGASLTLKRPDQTTLVVTTPVVNEAASLIAFGGTMFNFAGADAISVLGVTASADNTVALSSSDFALFTGTGAVAATLNGAGASTATGAGNLLALFHTQAGGFADVTYTYSPAVLTPEPAAMALFGLGIGAIGFARRRAK